MTSRRALLYTPGDDRHKIEKALKSSGGYYTVARTTGHFSELMISVL